MSDSDEKRKLEYSDLIFGVRRSIRYHVRRRAFFEFLNTLSTAAALIFGSATIATLIGNLGNGWTFGVAAVVTVTSAINLVVGSTRRAQLHWDLARKFLSLEKDLVSHGKGLTDEKLASLTACRLDIEAEEPPKLQVLDTLCHNELMRAMGYPKSEHVPVTWYQRWLANLMDVRAHSLHAPPTTQA